MQTIHDRDALSNASGAGGSRGGPSLPVRRLRDVTADLLDLVFRLSIFSFETHGSHLCGYWAPKGRRRVAVPMLEGGGRASAPMSRTPTAWPVREGPGFLWVISMNGIK